MMLRLNLEAPSTPAKSFTGPLAAANLDYRYRPFGGLILSILTHSLIFTVLLFIPLTGGASERQKLLEKAVIMDVHELARVLYLPPLESAAPEAEPAKKEGEPGAPKAAAPARRTQGFTYPGPQEIVSDYERPTNRILTVLQPDLVNPETLKPPLLLPNVVKMANAGPTPLVRPPEEKRVPPPPPPPPEPRKAAADLITPALETPQLARMPATQVARLDNPQPVPEALKLPEPPVEAPKLNAPFPTSGPDTRNLLVLSPMPAPPAAPVPVPPGEARGRFAISPNAETSPTATTLGTNGSAPSPTANALGKAPAGEGTASAESAKKDAPVGGSAAGRAPAGGGGGGIEITTTSPATVGAGAFEGITIVGGVGNNNRNAKPAAEPAPLQLSYGITVLSAGNAGASLPNYGVFANEQVYTAFIDMRRSVTDNAPTWAAEYALLKPAGPAVSGANGGGTQGVVLPFPAVKELPLMDAELVRRFSRRKIVVYAVINTQGKLEQIAVKESPDPALNPGVLNALAKWVFRPAEREGEIVAAKVLFGIPLWSPQ
jgi:hypothetical protein